ncbi:AMP-binding enzyme [Kitasatospora griseola]|uniref:AMP-binding enzyme n=1 Tax=Kitasatospora griseola TaxID=2064 RepID=UPI0022869E73|nr:hypothetical protein [Kitasatospora griseola]
MARIKQTVNRGGVSIGLSEVERLLEGHPGLVEAVCVPVPDPDLGERMCVCAVPREPAGGLALVELTDYLGQLCGLEKYKWPERLVLLDRLPLGASGKPDRLALTELATSSTREQEAAVVVS